MLTSMPTANPKITQQRYMKAEVSAFLPQVGYAGTTNTRKGGKGAVWGPPVSPDQKTAFD